MKRGCVILMFGLILLSNFVSAIELSDIGPQFLWKESHSSGRTHLALIPRTLDGLYSYDNDAKICQDISCDNVLGTGYHHGTYDSKTRKIRFILNHNYNNVYLVIELYSGKKLYWHLTSSTWDRYITQGSSYSKDKDSRIGKIISGPQWVGCEPGEIKFEDIPCAAPAIGACSLGTKDYICGSDMKFAWSSCTPRAPGAEKCNGLDDNCNNEIDEGCDNDNDGYLTSSKLCGVGYEIDHGWGGATPVPADYDNDGQTDLAVFRGANEDIDGGVDWYIRYSSTNQVVEVDYGFAGTTPVPADYDGDGKIDLAVKNAAKLFVKYSTGARVELPLSRVKNDLSLTGDYDGDGKTELASYDKGRWKFNCENCSGLINVPNNKGCSELDLDDNDPAIGSVYPCEADTDCGDDGNTCTSQRCDLNTHQCVIEFNTNSCETGDLCLIDGACLEGVCIETPKCNDGRQCSSDSCNQLTGICTFDTLNCACDIDSECDDNNPCTDNTCSNGQCVLINNTAACNDGSNCTDNDMCSMGSCLGTPKALDDGNLLTLDACLANGTVIHETSFDLSAHLESQSSQNNDQDEEATSSGSGGSSIDLDTSVDSSLGNVDNSGTSLPGQDTDDEGKISPVLLIIIVSIILILIGLAIFVLPGIISKSKKTTTPAQPQPRGPARRMPPRI